MSDFLSSSIFSVQTDADFIKTGYAHSLSTPQWRVTTRTLKVRCTTAHLMGSQVLSRVAIISSRGCFVAKLQCSWAWWNWAVTAVDEKCLLFIYNWMEPKSLELRKWLGHICGFWFVMDVLKSLNNITGFVIFSQVQTQPLHTEYTVKQLVCLEKHKKTSKYTQFTTNPIMQVTVVFT